MTDRPGLGPRFRLRAVATTFITTLLIALPTHAQHEQMSFPRPAISSRPTSVAQSAPPSEQEKAAQDGKDKPEKQKTPE
jgi:hypothetical protein